MMKHPSLHEINTRVWLQRFSTGTKKATLSDIPDSYWDELASKGIECVWLMGVWKPCANTIEKYCLEQGLVSSYQRALADWHKSDVIGSPYSIDCYELNPSLGKEKDLSHLRKSLNKRGMKLILDFVPNHFSAESSLLAHHPEVFFSVETDYAEKDLYTYYQPFPEQTRYFAHGRDPNFAAWQDTLQVNYFSNTARKYMREILSALSKKCDGLRCDMAILALNDVFEKTWDEALRSESFSKPGTEFWSAAISKVKKAHPGFIFIAEAYWDLEWELQQLGFDYTYDKRLMDRLLENDVSGVKAHLLADTTFQSKSVRYLENHDEERAVAAFGTERSKAAAVVMSTLQGMRFYHDGQFEGKAVRLPVQLGREPLEPVISEFSDFYDTLLKLVNHEVFKEGTWTLLEPYSKGDDDQTYHNIFAWLWILGDQKRLVVVNYSDQVSACHIGLDVENYDGEITFLDLLNDEAYIYSVRDIAQYGLYIELGNCQSHILSL